MTIVYDTRFNSSEWFIVVLLLCGYTFYFLTLKKRFSVKHSLVYLLFGVFVIVTWDHSIGVEPIDFYDVNNTNKTDAMDVLHYLMFGPFSYLFVYIYDAFRIKSKNSLLYILVWSLFALFMEWLSVQFGLYHYKNGFRTFYSFPFYISAQWALLLLFYRLERKRIYV